MIPRLGLKPVDSTSVIDESTKKLIGIGNYLLVHFGVQNEFEEMFNKSIINSAILLSVPAQLRDRGYSLSYDYNEPYVKSKGLNGQLPEFIRNHLLLMITDSIIGVEKQVAESTRDQILDQITNNVSPEQWSTFWTVFKQCYCSFNRFLQIEQPPKLSPIDQTQVFRTQTSGACDLDDGVTNICEAHPNIKPTLYGKMALRQCLLARQRARMYGGYPNINYYLGLLVSTGLTKTEAKTLLGV